jgi:cation transport ATPase
MTCASCPGRIERKLRKLDGVQATVNFATEKAEPNGNTLGPGVGLVDPGPGGARTRNRPKWME